jgi:hypothetical protein
MKGSYMVSYVRQHITFTNAAVTLALAFALIGVGYAASRLTTGAQANAGTLGKPGNHNAPWPAAGTLPPGRTETGAWSVSGSAPSTLDLVLAQISFPIPLAISLGSDKCDEAKECQVHYINDEGEEISGYKEKTPKNCTGTVGQPTAAPGNLCVYEQQSGGIERGEGNAFIIPTSRGLDAFPNEGQVGTDPNGAILVLKGKAATAYFGWGSWAVTAPGH